MNKYKLFKINYHESGGITSGNNNSIDLTNNSGLVLVDEYQFFRGHVKMITLLLWSNFESHTSIIAPNSPQHLQVSHITNIPY